MKRNTKGITIIELMLGVVLFSIVALAVTYFIFTGTKICREAETAIHVQEESQIVMNQLLTITMEADNLEKKEDIVTGDIRFYVMDMDKNFASTKTEKILYYQKSSGKLYYYEVDATASSADIAQISMELSGGTSNIIAGQLLGEYLKDFDVDIDTHLHNVEFELLFDLNGKEMKSKDSITLRNQYVERKDAFIDPM
ncbi:PilW family protein [[Clostridium] polysaccharolyticum]|uniref:Prepilin-type N-terminal cleavage/methylation domain-containing protein n=1 Tax=[Clostridium] polysaccharolyticum TaxID=29364 RepID=A0A1H9ZRY4_9FIRM|nr:prepilin-type N-terminal cleavage/methylation domain-containing protein [[Clostridium] polysaccharolyticum]SES84401.1 hypothetical protein SAMN04487772_10484 [[Clostridium] polysaccharolyticum]